MATRMGFTAPVIPASDPAAVSADAVYSFDSGTSISMTDLTHHILALGSTGSGKTVSVALPILAALLERGCGGLIIDLKGNLRSHVRKLARAAGVEDRLVEYGTGPYATPLNLMENMTFAGFNTFFENLVKRSFSGQTGNMDFHLRGAIQAADCARLLVFLKGAVEGLEVNAATVSEMIDDEKSAQELYKFFKDNVFDKKNEAHQEFVTSVESSLFHVLFCPSDYKGEKDRSTQMAYELGAVRAALRRFLAVPNVTDKFCAPGAHGLDMNLELVAGRIVLLRFDPDTGSIGEDLARQFISEYYAAVYKFGLELPQHSFILMGEYQEIASLGNDRYSDKKFIAMAREFKACMILLTQSLAALGSSPETAGSVDALVSNCNTRVLFYSDDPATQAMAARYGDVDLTTLEPQQAFVVRYDSSTRRHVHSFETVNAPYASGQEKLARGEQTAEPPEPPQAPSRVTLREFTRRIKSQPREPEPQAPQADKPSPEQTKPESADMPSEIPDSVDADLIPEAVLEFITASRKEPEPAPEEPKKPAPDNEIARAFPQFFPDDDICDFPMPIGWKKHIRMAFIALAASGLPLKVQRISTSRGHLQVRAVDDERQYTLGLLLINGLLTQLWQFCSICGRKLGERSELESSLSICPDCWEKFEQQAQNMESTAQPQQVKC